MFTGLIQSVGRLLSSQATGGDLRMRFAVGALPFGDAELGESIACNGVCLTVVAFEPAQADAAAWFDADVSTETLARTTLGALVPGAAVNLERALRLGDRLGGHLVSGHVDGVGRVEAVSDDARGQRWRFSAPRPLLRFIAEKGSIAVEGVSLTVNAVDDAGFEVMLVPHTLAHTGFGTMAAGAPVNLEIDTVARYVARLQQTEGLGMSFASVPELLEEIRAGRMVVIVDDEDRENEGDLIMAAELVRPQDINFMVTHARGLVCLSLTRERCRQLGLPPMVRDNTSPHGTNFTVSIEAAEGVTTGISAYDRAHTIRTAVRPDARPHDLSQPGHIFPLMAQPGGVLVRAGHTEAASDLALLAGLEPAGVLVEILNPDGGMARRPQLEIFAREHGLKMGSIEDLIRHRLHHEHTVERLDVREIATEHGLFLLHTYRDQISRCLHFALLRGAPDPAVPTLVRVHLQNPLADALHWRRPDFGPAVGEVLARIAAEGRGALVVLGESATPDALLARIVQAGGEAHDPTGHEHASPEPAPANARGGAMSEWRRNGAGSQILADLGLGKLRVLGTSRKQIGLAGFGLEVVEYVAP